MLDTRKHILTSEHDVEGSETECADSELKFRVVGKSILDHSWRAHASEGEHSQCCDVESIPMVLCVEHGALPESPWKDLLRSWLRKWFSSGLGVLPRTAKFHRAL